MIATAFAFVVRRSTVPLGVVGGCFRSPFAAVRLLPIGVRSFSTPADDASDRDHGFTIHGSARPGTIGLPVPVIPDFVSEAEEAVLVRYIDSLWGRRRYEFDHWDQVISGFREMQLMLNDPSASSDSRPADSLVYSASSAPVTDAHLAETNTHKRPLSDPSSSLPGTAGSRRSAAATALPAEFIAEARTVFRSIADRAHATIDRLVSVETSWDPATDSVVRARDLTAPVADGTPVARSRNWFPYVHILDLAKKGEIRAHIDAVKFSGDIVAGISLLTPSVVTLQRGEGEHVVNFLLPRRSLYIQYGDVRFHYTHEIADHPPGSASGVQFLGDGNTALLRQRRISLIFRNEIVATEHQ